MSLRSAAHTVRPCVARSLSSASRNSTSLQRRFARRGIPFRVERLCARRLFSASPLLPSQGQAKPLVELKDAILATNQATTSAESTISLTIQDTEDEHWAIIAPPSSIGPGSLLLASLVGVLVGSTRARRSSDPTLRSNKEWELHPSPHPFAGQHQGLVALASFSKQSTSAGSAEFQDFSKRYGALREEDLVTLYERLMEMQGFEVGRVADMKILPDKLTSPAIDKGIREHARATKARIERLAPLLGLLKPGPGSPGGEPLLYQPLISLSNGQLRRARIVSALIGLEETVGEAARKAGTPAKDLTSLLVLDQPYSGLDEPSRMELGQLLASLHRARKPRIIQVLRRQDDLPHGITHIVDIDSQGKLWAGPRSDWKGEGAVVPKGIEGIRKNREAGIGKGSGQDLVALHGVSVQYGTKVVLESIDLTLRQGTRLIVKGANGSGKTTLLSLLSGTHPQSFSLPLEKYVLFGNARASPANASRLLARKIGYFGPDLLAAFPRKGIDSGGLTVGGAIASGFSGVFSRIDVTSEQIDRVRALISAFSDCIAFRETKQRSEPSVTAAGAASDDVALIMRCPFIELTSGSQALVLFLRAIANDPSILILDEPFQGMDAAQIARIQEYIDGRATSQLRPQPECAIVLVSHYVSEWPDSMGEFVHLQDGKVIQRI